MSTEPTPHHIALAVDGLGMGQTVLDGVELSDVVKAVHIQTCAGEPTTLILELGPLTTYHADLTTEQLRVLEPVFEAKVRVLLTRIKERLLRGPIGTDGRTELAQEIETLIDYHLEIPHD